MVHKNDLLHLFHLEVLTRLVLVVLIFQKVVLLVKKLHGGAGKNLYNVHIHAEIRNKNKKKKKKKKKTHTTTKQHLTQQLTRIFLFFPFLSLFFFLISCYYFFVSGGGFSDTFAIPSYQTDVVAAYKKNAAAAGTLPAATKWNNTGRGFPDVSALGGRVNQYCIAIDGKESAAYGTSAATPVIATVIAKLNEVRLNAGGKPLGFINPLIFKHSECFNDVVSGNNAGRNGLKSGFTAMKGWDPLTGLGTPNFDALKSVVLKTMK